MSDALTDLSSTPLNADGSTEPSLKRTLGGFQVFAVSFSFISVAVGVFATYDTVLQGSGPVGIWLWILVAVGQILVALVYAQFAGRIALSGSSHQWGSLLANPKIGYAFGWMTVFLLAIGPVAIDNALASTALMPLFGMEPDEQVARFLTVGVLLVQVVIVLASTRAVGIINSSAVALEIGLVAVLAVGLVIAVIAHGSVPTENLLSQGTAGDSPDYFAVGGGLMDAVVLGLATLVGFEAAANMAEEAKDPFRTVPRAIIGSVVAAAVLGLVFLVALTVAITDIPRVTASDSPVATIIKDQLGPDVERILLVGISCAFFGAGLAVMTSASRLVFAMSRDGRFPGHRVMRRVNARTQTPVPATLLTLAVGIVMMVALPGHALLLLIIAATITSSLLYGGTIVLYLAVRRRLDRREGSFDLGCFELPVSIAALVWVVGAVISVINPPEAYIPDLVVVGILAVGGVVYYFLNRSNPSAFASTASRRPRPGST
ncbi:MAG: amino acid permease [Lapillicoccus sp.]